MSAILFLGPSLPAEKAREILPDAVILPPAKAGDLLSAASRYRQAVIGLVDGVFGQSLSVWHKEILWALEQGIAVYGAASIGAIRAAEVPGMVGVGAIHEGYASGEITDDDEVALLHEGPERGYAKLSEPMVNVRATLARARREGACDAAQEAAALQWAKSTFYAFRQHCPFPEFYVDQKATDALALCRVIAGHEAGPEPGASLARSVFFDATYERERRGVAGIPLREIETHAAVAMGRYDDLRDAALNRALVGILARLLGVTATREECDREYRHLARRLGITSLADWCAQNDLTRSEYHDLVESEAVARVMRRTLLDSRMLLRGTRPVLDQMRLMGLYPSVAARAAQGRTTMGPHWEALEADPELLADWIRESGYTDGPTLYYAAEELMARTGGGDG